MNTGKLPSFRVSRFINLVYHKVIFWLHDYINFHSSMQLYPINQWIAGLFTVRMLGVSCESIPRLIIWWFLKNTHISFSYIYISGIISRSFWQRSGLPQVALRGEMKVIDWLLTLSFPGSLRTQTRRFKFLAGSLVLN